MESGIGVKGARRLASIELSGPFSQGQPRLLMPDALPDLLESAHIAAFGWESVDKRDQPPVSAVSLGQGEAEGVEAGHAEAHVGYQQLARNFVVAQHAAREPLQTSMLRRLAQYRGEPFATWNGYQFGWSVIEPAHQRFMVAIIADDDDPP